MIPLRDNIPARRYPIVTVSVIVLNVLVFLYEFVLGQRALDQFIWSFGMVPARLNFSVLDTVPDFGVTMLTSMFLHGSLLHLVGNMWFLWIFADNVEDRMGSVRFAFFYLLCGILAGLAHLAFNSDSRIPTIGASGAVAGVLGAYLICYPFARVLTLFPLIIVWPVVELPALFFLIVWFLTQLLSGTLFLAGGSSAGIAWFAHIGGFLAGMLLVGRFSLPLVRNYYWE